MTVPAEQITSIHALLTLVASRLVHGDGDFRDLALPPASPGWSPVAAMPTPGSRAAFVALGHGMPRHGTDCSLRGSHPTIAWQEPTRQAGQPLWGGIGCVCFVF